MPLDLVIVAAIVASAVSGVLGAIAGAWWQGRMQLKVAERAERHQAVREGREVRRRCHARLVSLRYRIEVAAVSRQDALSGFVLARAAKDGSEATVRRLEMDELLRQIADLKGQVFEELAVAEAAFSLSKPKQRLVAAIHAARQARDYHYPPMPTEDLKAKVLEDKAKERERLREQLLDPLDRILKDLRDEVAESLAE